MNLSDKIAIVWNNAFADAMGCGRTEDQAEAHANRATADLRAALAAVQRAQMPQTPRHSNLAGRRQHAARRAS